MPRLNINTDAAVIFANKLEKLHKSGLPVAVRTSLNSAAFDVKTKTMPVESNKAFTNRKKNFFKAKSRVKTAKGFNYKTMRSLIGFVGAENNQAVRDLEQQEHGGKVGGRTFIPLDTARISKSNSKLVRKPNQVKNLRGIHRVKNKKNFIRNAHKVGVGGFLIYNDTLFKVNRLLKNRKVKLLPLYSFKKGRSVKVKPTNFMKKASMKSRQKLDDFFIIEAKKQIRRLTK